MGVGIRAVDGRNEKTNEVRKEAGDPKQQFKKYKESLSGRPEEGS